MTPDLDPDPDPDPDPCSLVPLTCMAAYVYVVHGHGLCSPPQGMMYISAPGQRHLQQVASVYVYRPLGPPSCMHARMTCMACMAHMARTARTACTARMLAHAMEVPLRPRSPYPARYPYLARSPHGPGTPTQPGTPLPSQVPPRPRPPYPASQVPPT